MQIYTIPVSGGKPLQMTNMPPACGAPWYSRNGKWIFFSVAPTGLIEI